MSNSGDIKKSLYEYKYTCAAVIFTDDPNFAFKSTDNAKEVVSYVHGGGLMAANAGMKAIEFKILREEERLNGLGA